MTDIPKILLDYCERSNVPTDNWEFKNSSFTNYERVDENGIVTHEGMICGDRAVILFKRCSFGMISVSPNTVYKNNYHKNIETSGEFTL